MGPIEVIAVNEELATLTVLGQPFETSAENASELAIGDYVVAAADPIVGTIIYPVGAPYVAGVSTVKVKANVTEVNAQIGTASLGSTTIDYTAALADDPTAVPSVDEPLEVVGTQPAALGVVLAGPGDSSAVVCPALDGRM
jgi:hypothetical protein